MLSVNQNIESLGIIELEKIIEQYPWYSGARVHLLYKLSEMGEECFNQKFRDSAAFIPNRSLIYREAREIFSRIKVTSSSLDTEEFTTPSEPIEPQKPYVRKVHIIGGDYFSKQDFDDFNKNSQEEPQINKKTRTGQTPPPKYTSQGHTMEEEDFNSPGFLTETWAQILADQDYNEQAIEIYSKLILLYPEKSAYFAGLAEQVKLKK